MVKKSLILKVIVIILPIIGLFLPLWALEFHAPMFGQKWLKIIINGYGGIEENPPKALEQINIANHYVGLPEIVPEEMIEIKVLPLFYIISAILAALIAFIKRARPLIFVYAILIILIPAYFQYWLYNFGHNINYKEAAVKIEPFTPLVMGSYRIANFSAITYFHIGYWLIVASLLINIYLVKKGY